MLMRKELALAALFAITICGCRFKAYESMNSATSSEVKLPYKGDPYTFGGMQEGTGGLIAASKGSMETETYSEPKFKKLAGPDAFISMTGHSLSKAEPSDTRGDFQPLPSASAHEDAGASPAETTVGH